jgi:bla regulator protein blaR1
MSTARRVKVLGFLASLAIHVSAAAIALPIALSLGRPVPRLSAGDVRDPDGGRAHAPSRDLISRQAQVESLSRRDAWSVAQPIDNLGTSARLDAGSWLNHLWQSTLFALAVGLLTIALRRNHARIRYGLWFSCSVKFFVPFSLLVTLGSRLPLPSSVTTTAVVPAVSSTIAQVSQPFLEGGTSGVAIARPTPGSAGWVGLAILGLWACGFAAIVVLRFRMWRRIRRAVHMSAAVDIPYLVLPPHVQVRATPGLMEPGVVGFWRPTILLPAGIEEHLTPAQLEAVLAHELCHVRRRDNLTAALHMVVEAVFWFHPLVWWIGSRLVHERERACDEEVLRTLDRPRVYAEGILNVCKRYVDARLACVSGVSGSNLKARIEAIMRNQRGEALGSSKKLLLATAGIAAVTVPMVIGSLGAPRLRAQAPARSADAPTFQTTSIEPNGSGDTRMTLMPQPGGRLTATNVTVAALIRFAYDLPDFQVSGGPNWLTSDRFDILANAKGDPPVAQQRLMLRRVLEERFKLVAHTEMRVLPIYALVLARSDGEVGPRIRRSDAECARIAQPTSDSGVGLSPLDGPPCGFFGFAPGTDFPSGRGGLAFRGLTMPTLAKRLVPMVRRNVIDQTGLAGQFDAEFDFIAELPLPPPPPGLPNPFSGTQFTSVFTVFPEQLGLRLDARQGSVEVLVIDRADKPTER